MGRFEHVGHRMLFAKPTDADVYQGANEGGHQDHVYVKIKENYSLPNAAGEIAAPQRLSNDGRVLNRLWAYLGPARHRCG